MSRWAYVVLTAVLAVVVAIWAIPHLGGDPATTVWIEGGELLGVSLAVHLDTLAAQVLLLAVCVGLLVQIYSTAYLGHHRRYRSYALVIVLFLLGMIAVVAADDLFVLLIGWEVMGLCSYLLIGHEWERSEARSGAAKAFLMTRVADLGLLVAIVVIGQAYGTYRISEVLAQEPRHATAIGLLLLVAVIGKSAQFPLHTWLPDAMPGPTPITALIHAATMVAAGVYLVARLLPILVASELVMTLLAIVSAVTMLLAALLALAQTDLKRALAWSTVSQLALMFAALAAGDGEAGTDHLLSHGVFKALLFLGCGCLMHAVGSSALSAMGGLCGRMPVTFWTMTIGLAALAGIVPTAGFFTKDSVLAAVGHARDGGPLPVAVAWGLLVVALVASLLTAAYATRLWLLVFFGPGSTDRSDAYAEPRAMTGPLVVLAAAAFALSIGQPLHVGIGVLSTAVAATGIGVVTWHWRAGRSLDLDRPWLSAELGLDRPYARWLPAALGSSARAVVDVDRDGVDAYSHGSAATAVLVSRGLALVQSRNVQRYATVIVVGVAVLTAAAVIAS